MNLDEFHGEGGTFEVRDGKRILVTPPTQPHPDGDRARNADGKPVDETPAAAEAAPPATESTRLSRFFGRADPENSSDN
jgi:hypothetical protein